MNKEEILAKSREENKMGDEMEVQIRLKAAKIAKACGIVVAFILVFIGEVIGISVIGWTALTITFGMNVIEDWIIIIKTKNKSEWFTTIFDTVLLINSIIVLVRTVL